MKGFLIFIIKYTHSLSQYRRFLFGARTVYKDLRINLAKAADPQYMRAEVNICFVERRLIWNYMEALNICVLSYLFMTTDMRYAHCRRTGGIRSLRADCHGNACRQ